jgi:hypothetical protein
MGSEAERPSRRWKWVAFAALLAAAGSLAALVVVLALPARTARMTDDRLIGTWQSDADRTIAGIRERTPVDDKQEAVLRKLFGKMRVTYTPTTYTTELDGTTASYTYEVLGKDKQSVVIHEVGRKPSPLDGVVALSEFAVIHFDGPDSYWLYTQIGGIREYFKRVR